MINCRIISISPKDIQDVQDFGHESDNFGKIRYRKRRENILQFISSYKNDNLNIKLFNAITPDKFNRVDDKISFNNEFYDFWGSLFYTANTFSHLEILKIDEDTLVLEDDIFLDEEILNKIPELIEYFSKIEEINKVLYLQLSVPWVECERELNVGDVNEKISIPFSMNFSGTAAYFIKKECKKIIIENIDLMSELDGAFDKYMSLLNDKSIIKYYVPKHKDDMFRLDYELVRL